jgi:hypothetical protein
MDLQQLTFVPTLTDSEALYRPQLFCYNSAICVDDIQQPCVRVRVCVREREKGNTVQYFIDLMDLHLADLGFNGPNFGTLSGIYAGAAPARQRPIKSGKHSPIVIKTVSGQLFPPGEK